MECMHNAEQFFRLWIVRVVGDWRPQSWREVPTRAVAVEPVEDALYSQAEATVFAQTFNQVMVESERPLWVVAVPVTLRLEGDATCGMPIVGYALDGGVVEGNSPAVGGCC